MALMMRFRWNKPCAADSWWLTSPRNAAERGMVPEGIHAKAAEATFPARFPAPDNAHPNAGVLRLHVHLMLSLFEIFHDWPGRVEREDRGGGGLARTAAPDHGNFLQ